MESCQSSNTYLPWCSQMLSILALVNVSDDCWTPANSFANVIEVAINR